MFVGTSEILLPLMVKELVAPFNAAAVDDGVDDDTAAADDDGLLLDGDCGSESESGDDGGDALISSNGGDLLPALLLRAPFNAELLANCKYADNFGKISLTSSISLLNNLFE